MELKQLNTVIKAFHSTSVKEITLESKTARLHIVKGQVLPPKTKKQPVETMGIIQQTKNPQAITQSRKDDNNDILSKHIGYFSRFNPKKKKQIVKLRDTVKKGDLVAIVKGAHIEHKVYAEKPGKIIEFLVEEGQPVEYGQPLIRLENK